MGNIGDWRSPLPFKLGGRSHEIVDSMYKVVRSARPDMLAGGEGTEVDMENRALARMLGAGIRATKLRVAQRDPATLSTLRRAVTFPDGTIRVVSMLERWEAILLITPAEGATDNERRAVVGGRRAATISNDVISLSEAMGRLFGSWFVRISSNHVSDVDYATRPTPGSVYAHFGGPSTTFSADYPGSYDADYPWYSGVAQVTVVIQPPASVPQAEIDRRTAQALSLLDDTLPTWAQGDVSQLPADQTEDGFYAGISLVGLTAV